MNKEILVATIAVQELNATKDNLQTLLNQNLYTFDKASDAQYAALEAALSRVEESIRLFQTLSNPVVYEDDGRVPLTKKPSEMSKDELIEYINLRRPFQNAKGGKLLRVKYISEPVKGPEDLQPIRKEEAILTYYLNKLSKPELSDLMAKYGITYDITKET